MSYITISGVSYAYPGSSVSIFDGLSLSFYDGWTVLAGANGAGKTTLAALIAGMIVPDAGTISRSGEAILCPQVFTGLSDEDPFYIYDGTRETGEMMSRLGITDGMIADPEVLSGGEKKRLQLLAALARRPEIPRFSTKINGSGMENPSASAAARIIRSWASGDNSV